MAVLGLPYEVKLFVVQFSSNELWFKSMPHVYWSTGRPLGGYQTAQQKVLLHTEGLKQPKQVKTAMFKAIEMAVFDESYQKFQLLVLRYDVKFHLEQ